MKLKELLPLFTGEFKVLLKNDLSDFFGETCLYLPHATDYKREYLKDYLDYTVVCIREDNEVVIRGAKSV